MMMYEVYCPYEYCCCRQKHYLRSFLRQTVCFVPGIRQVLLLDCHQLFAVTAVFFVDVTSLPPLTHDTYHPCWCYCTTPRLFFRQAFDEQHAPEAAAELMCSWAADSSKLLRPLSRMIVQGVDSTSHVDVDSWLIAMRSWLELEDTLQVGRLV